MKKFFAKLFSPVGKFFRYLGDRLYDLQSYVYSKLPKKKRNINNGRNINTIRDIIFLAAFLVVPLAFAILQHIIINGNAILLAFQKYEGRKIVFAGFENFQTLINDFQTKLAFKQMLRNSVLVYVLSTTILSVVPVIFTYYVYKKLFGSNLFKIILFIPTILSSIITVSMYKMIVNEVVPEIYLMITGTKIKPLFSNMDTAFGTVLFYSIWMGLGGGLLTQLAAMNTVDPSVTESAQLEGIGFFGELWHIVLPACYEVLTLGFITGIAGIFTNTLNLYAFKGTGAPSAISTIGYYFEVQTLSADFADYPYLSAWGVLVTTFVTPATLLLRYVINRYGPSEDTHEKKKKRTA